MLVVLIQYMDYVLNLFKYSGLRRKECQCFYDVFALLHIAFSFLAFTVFATLVRMQTAMRSQHKFRVVFGFESVDASQIKRYVFSTNVSLLLSSAAEYFYLLLCDEKKPTLTYIDPAVAS